MQKKISFNTIKNCKKGNFVSYDFKLQLLFNTRANKQKSIRNLDITNSIEVTIIGVAKGGGGGGG